MSLMSMGGWVCKCPPSVPPPRVLQQWPRLALQHFLMVNFERLLSRVQTALSSLGFEPPTLGLWDSSELLDLPWHWLRMLLVGWSSQTDSSFWAVAEEGHKTLSSQLCSIRNYSCPSGTHIHSVERRAPDSQWVGSRDGICPGALGPSEMLCCIFESGETRYPPGLVSLFGWCPFILPSCGRTLSLVQRL